MSGHSPNPIFFNKKDWTLRTFAAPPNPSTSDKDPFLSHPNPNPIHTHSSKKISWGFLFADGRLTEIFHGKITLAKINLNVAKTSWFIMENRNRLNSIKRNTNQAHWTIFLFFRIFQAFCLHFQNFVKSSTPSHHTKNLQLDKKRIQALQKHFSFLCLSRAGD